jgi:peptidase A4-like protein
MHSGRISSLIAATSAIFLALAFFSQNAIAGTHDVSTGWRISTDVKGCAPGTVLWVPTHPYDYYLNHPHTLKAPPGDKPDMKTLQRAAKNHSRPLTSLRCQQGHPGHPLPQVSHPSHTSNATTTNWSGYETDRDAGFYLAANMNWSVPAVTLSDKSVVSSIWPGIGRGSSSSDPLMQLGTEQDGTCLSLDCTTHSTSYYAWYEIFPQEAQQRISNFSIAPGDDISTGVAYNYSNQVFFDIYDLTKNTDAHASRTASVAKGRSSGEWIVERTAVGSSLPSLNNFGIEELTSAQVDSIPSHNWNDAEQVISGENSGPFGIDMHSCSGQELAKTLSWTSSTAFPVEWLNYGPTDHTPCT